jgi:transposase, IS5 family
MDRNVNAALIMRDVERQVAHVADSGRAALMELIGRTKRILTQKLKEKSRLYAACTGS